MNKTLSVRRWVVVLGILIVFRAGLNAQPISVDTFRSELNIKISAIDEKKIEKGVDILNEAKKIEKEALSILEEMPDTELIFGMSRRYKKAVKDLLEASEEYQEGHTLIYDVFSENCEKFRSKMKKMNHYASGMQKAKYYELKAEQTIKRSKNIRELFEVQDKPEWIQYKMQEAENLERLAVRNKGRALQIYQDFPVEYNYGWEDDVTAEQVAEAFKDPNIKLPPEKAFKPRPKTKEGKVIPPKGGEIVFRVQVGAHVSPFTEAGIKTFYKGDEKVLEIYENGWYKYQIGKFDSYEAAHELLKSTNVERAFVVAYQDGKKLTIKEALQKMQDN